MEAYRRSPSWSADSAFPTVAEALSPDWSGGNGASFGAATTQMAGNGLNQSIPGADFTSGTINLTEGLQVFNDQNWIPVVEDTDADGLADGWEAIYSPGDLSALSGGDADFDADGLTDEEEFGLGSNPTSDDSDNDGLTDGEEVEAGTNLLNPDSDGDTLLDGDEVNGDPATNPLSADTDGDGFTDDAELAIGSDPTDPDSLPPAICEGVTELPEVPTLFFDTIGPLATFNGQGGGNDLLDATFEAVVDIDEKLDGAREVIFETGAGTIGFSIVYEAPNQLVLRATGNGGFSLAVARFVVPPAVLDAGPVVVGWTYDIENGQLRQQINLLIEGVVVASRAMDVGGDWSGGDPGAYGAASGNIAGTGANSGLTGIAFESGSIDEAAGLSFWADTMLCPETTDSDADGIADELEDIYAPGDLDALASGGDADMDGLLDEEELALGTAPTVADSDGDGLEDGDEVALGANPFATDSDGDGISDGDEVNGDPATSPILADTDEDGIADGEELAFGWNPADSANPAIVADSIAEFTTTGTQGENNWSNGLYNLTTDADSTYATDDFIPFTNSCAPDDGPCEEGGPVAPDGNHWTGTTWDLTGSGGPWTFIGPTDTHPNGTNSAPNEEHWSVRRWESTIDGEVALVWHTRKTNLNGTGVTGLLFVDGEEVDGASIAGNDGAGVTRSVVLSVEMGTIVDLALTSGRPDG